MKAGAAQPDQPGESQVAVCLKLFPLDCRNPPRPHMGGVALAKELRRRLPDLPAVLTSGYSHVLAQEGADGFELLHKPYSADQLSRILRKVTAVSSKPR